MDGSSPATAVVIELVLPYLNKKTLASCKTLNKAWLALVTLHSTRSLECHILRLPLRIMHFRRKGLLSLVRSLTVDISYLEGFLSAPMYERRINDAVALLQNLPVNIRHIKIHMPGASTTLTNAEIRFGSMAFTLLLQALPNLATLDLSDCPVALLAASQRHDAPFASLARLQNIRWFSLGSNDMSSAAELHRLVCANQHTLTAISGKGDITDRTLIALSKAPRFTRLDASGSSISDDALLTLVRARGSGLRELVLSDCTRLTKRSIAHLSPKALPTLAVLDLYNIMVTTDVYQRLFNFATRWPYLRDLKLKAAIPDTSPRQDLLVNDDILEAIGRNCPRLVSLRLFGCHGITDNGLSSILGNLGYLRELVVMHSASDPVAPGEDVAEQGGAPAGGGRGEPVTMSPRLGNNVLRHEAPALDGPEPSTTANGLLLSLPSISDIWADIPSLPSNAIPQHNHAQVQRVTGAPTSSAPDTPRLSEEPRRNANGQRIFTSRALQKGLRSNRFNLLNLDMEYDSVCASHFAKLAHLHVLCGRMITRHAKSLIEGQFPQCKMMVWNTD
ncbi:hypothetical protein IWW39_004680 [Coemansia spiralis]|uniref:F-box/LRR-repeat protein 15-like leucin rich repeat domain-containing protein n=1 Tax=Coemansia spiralis TaxID=417178 RepID=A0A9W8L3F0_9FUNG|nr:hypothetical protein IWW39_004680 [Coemansia spiralis]